MTTIALFPLATVLFPGGVLPLRVFEPRYVDMVRECLRNDHAFGVILITSGSEVGKVADHEEVGTLAKIIDFDMQEQGMLQITVTGGQRFRVLERHVELNQLIRAQVELIDADDLVTVPPALRATQQLLEGLLKQMPTETVAKPHRLDDCAWVANRLCEVLPIPNTTKQKMMALEDSLSRLELIQHFLRQQKILG